MRAKTNVILDGCCFEIGYAAAFIEQIILRLSVDRVMMVVTSAHDGTHHAGSLHYTGRAIDIRTRDLSSVKRKELFAIARLKLAPLGFDVVLESDHLHVEYDPKPGREFVTVVS